MSERYAYVVWTPVDGTHDGFYSTAAKAIARLRVYGEVPPLAVSRLQAGENISIIDHDDADPPWAGKERIR